MQGRSRCGVLLGALTPIALSFLLAAGGPAFAQSTAVERNLPEAPRTTGGEIRIDASSAGSTDETPFGVSLAGVTLIGVEGAPPLRPSPGISVEGLADADPAALSARLSPFVGQPLSHALIGRIQSAVAGTWRDAGYPFMSVTVPPQEITSGVLTLRVVEFVAGAITTDAGSRVRHDRLTRQIRQQPGERIDAAQLSEDLAWLNRNPFRNVGAVFAPGDTRGASDITLTVTEDKPFSVYAGWDNSGNPATGRDRFYVGGGVWLPMLNDATMAVRYTRSREMWSTGDIFSLDPARPGYLSAAGRIDLPTLPRQAISIAPNYVLTNEFVSGTPFSFENETFELPIFYRAAVSTLLPRQNLGEIYFGIEPKWLRRQTRFAGIGVGAAEAGLTNLVLGWTHEFADSHGRTTIDLRIKANPGGLVGNNSAAAWSAFTGGRVSDHTYVHAGIDVARTTMLPRGFMWSSAFSGQIAGQALPDTERLGLGGHDRVRGYASGIAVDSGFFWRNELRLPAFGLFTKAGIPDQLSPFGFVDLGHGRDIASGASTSLAGAGLGVDYRFGNHAVANLTAATALRASDDTRAGDWSVNASLRITY